MTRHVFLQYVLASVLALGMAAPVDAGWLFRAFHHHHAGHQAHSYVAAPVYYPPASYSYAAAAPQTAYSTSQAPQSAVTEILVPVLLEIVRSRIATQPTTGGRVDTSALETEVARIRREVADFRAELSGDVENANTTLQRHGQEIVVLRGDLAKLVENVAGIKSDVETIKAAVTAGGNIQTELSKIADRMPKATANELISSLTSNEVMKSIEGHPKLDPEERKALRSQLAKEIEAIVTDAFPQ